jgi:hypothetical protein
MRLPVATAPALRMLRARSLWLALGGWTLLAVAAALSARSSDAQLGASHVLLGVFGRVVLPLMTYAIVGAAIGPRSLRASVAPLVAFGASPIAAGTGVIAVAAIASAACGAALAATVAAIAHGPGDPARAFDAAASAYAAGFGGAAYAALFALGAAFGRRGGGRAAFLFADALLGAQTGAAALLVPRGHLRNLLGGAPPMNLPEPASAVALALLAIAFTALALRRVRR